MNPFSLYHLSAEYNQIMQEIEDADGVLTPELDARLEAVTRNLATQAANVKVALDMIGAGKDQIEEWIQKLSTRKAALEREEQRWKDAALQNMSGMGINTLEGELNGLPVKLRVMQTQHVQIIAQDLIPREFMREIPAKLEPDKKKIKAAIESGQDVLGAELWGDSYLRVF